MQTTASDVDVVEHSKAGLGLTSAVFLAFFLSLTLPRLTAGVLPCIALIALLTFRPNLARLWQAATGSTTAKALLLFMLYAFVNAFWSLDRGEAFAKVGLATAYLAFVLVVLPCFMQAGARESEKLVLALVLGAVAGVLIFAFELLGDQMLAKLFHALATPERDRPDSEDLNRNAGLLLLLFWPVLLAIGRLRSASRIALGALFLVVAVTAVGASQHETSKTALIVSAVIFAFCLWRLVMAHWCLITAWCAAFLFVVPAVTLAYKADLHFAEWLPSSAKARIVLWHETAKRIPEAPILGIGVRSTRLLFDAEAPSAETPKDFPYPLLTGRHAHNFFLQTWYELGLVGVFFFAAAGVAVLRRLRRLPDHAQAFAHAHFGAFMAVAATAWDMWQSWLIAGIGLSAVAMGIALARESVTKAAP